MRIGIVPPVLVQHPLTRADWEQGAGIAQVSQIAETADRLGRLGRAGGARGERQQEQRRLIDCRSSLHLHRSMLGDELSALRRVDQQEPVGVDAEIETVEQLLACRVGDDQLAVAGADLLVQCRLVGWG